MFFDLFHRIKIKNFFLAKHLSDKQKEKILELFLNGKTIDEISIEFSCTKLTISRNLKKNFGEDKFKSLIQKNKLNIKNVKNKKPEKESNNFKANLIESKTEIFSNQSSENAFLRILHLEK